MPLGSAVGLGGVHCPVRQFQRMIVKLTILTAVDFIEILKPILVTEKQESEKPVKNRSRSGFPARPIWCRRSSLCDEITKSRNMSETYSTSQKKKVSTVLFFDYPEFFVFSCFLCFSFPEKQRLCFPEICHLKNQTRLFFCCSTT